MSKGKKSKKLNKKAIAKLANGGFIAQNTQPIGVAANFAGDLVNTITPENSMGGNIASNALKGAASLSALGPWGMAAGAVGGGIMGAIQTKRQQKLQDEQNIQSQLATNKLLTQNAGNSFRDGGKMLTSKLNVEQGGNLEAVSQDAVQVKADNPNQTDSVELNQAFVDHNEIIDNKDRVFSDSIYLANRRSVAKEARRLEKMKSEKTRFNDANRHIEHKLDSLFRYQESQKQIPEGKLRKKFPNEDTFDYIDSNFNQLDYRGHELQDELENMKKKKKLSLGGPIPINMPTFKTIAPVMPAGTVSTNNLNSINQNLGTINKPTFTASPGIKAPIDIETAPGLDINALGTSLATFGPNVLSTVLQKRLKGPASPQLESNINLKRFSADPQITEANRQFSNAQRVIQKGTAQGSDLIAGTGSLLAKKLAAQNQIYGQINQVNSDVANKEAIINQGARVRNVERINNFRNDINDFDNRKVQLTTENAANLSQKVLMQGKERNEMDRDMFALDVLGKGYEDSGVLRRDTGKTIDSYVKKKGLKSKNKMGGRLKGIKC